MPICKDSFEDMQGNGICSVMEMHSSCAGGFTFFDSQKHHQAPLSLHNDKKRMFPKRILNFSL